MVIEQYINQLQDAKVIDLILASDVLIQSLVPQVKLEKKWKIPFYSYCGPLLYLNVSKGRFYLGFYNARQLSHVSELQDGLKVVSKLYITSLHDLNNPRVSEIIIEASMINEANLDERKQK